MLQRELLLLWTVGVAVGGNIDGLHTIYSSDHYADNAWLFGNNWGTNGDFKWYNRVTFPKRRPSMPGAVALQTRVNTWIGTSCGGKLGAGTVTTTTRIRTGSCGVDCNPSTLRAIAVADQIVTAFKSPRTRTTRGPHRTHRTIGGCCERFTPFSNRTSNTRLEWKVLPTAAWCTCCSMDKDVSWNKS